MYNTRHDLIVAALDGPHQVGLDRPCFCSNQSSVGGDFGLNTHSLEMQDRVQTMVTLSNRCCTIPHNMSPTTRTEGWGGKLLLQAGR